MGRTVRVGEGLYESATGNGFQRNGGSSAHHPREKGHGREEIRHYIQMPDPEDLPGQERWKGLKTIGLAMLTCQRDRKRNVRDALLHQQSAGMGVKLFARAVRAALGNRKTVAIGVSTSPIEKTNCIRNQHLRENFCLAQSLHFVIAQTAPGQAQPSHETTRLWLEYRLPPRSPVRQNDLVTAGPDSVARLSRYMANE